jgi:hypothetical protein
LLGYLEFCGEESDSSVEVVALVDALQRILYDYEANFG